MHPIGFWDIHAVCSRTPPPCLRAACIIFTPPECDYVMKSICVPLWWGRLTWHRKQPHPWSREGRWDDQWTSYSFTFQTKLKASVSALGSAQVLVFITQTSHPTKRIVCQSNSFWSHVEKGLPPPYTGQCVFQSWNCSDITASAQTSTLTSSGAAVVVKEEESPRRVASRHTRT